LRKAIEQDWPVPTERRGPLLKAALSVRHREDRTGSLVLAACRVALAADMHGFKPERRVTVEECLALPANRWASMPRSGAWRSEGWSGTVDYSFDPALSVLRLHYTPASPARQQQGAVACSVQLLAKPTQFGGARWWFHCPVEGCGRRVAKLYLPPGGRYFGCRHCHGLTYGSCRKGRK
jgi:hypothetical protein